MRFGSGGRESISSAGECKRMSTGDTLQQTTAFSHGSSRLMSLGAGVAADTYLIRLKCRPIQKPNVMIMNQHWPFLHRQATASLSHNAPLIDVLFRTVSSIHVGTCVNGIGEHLMDRPVRRRLPS